MSNLVELIFTKTYGQWKAGEVINFPEAIANTIIKAGAAKVRNPEIPPERKTTKSKIIKKSK